MFPRVIEEYTIAVTLTRDQESIHFTLKCSFVNGLKINQSISHSRVYLTVVSMAGDTCTVTVMKETLDHLNLRLLKVGEKINVERSMMMNERLDEYIVQGHVDQTTECIGIKDTDRNWYFTLKYVFDKEMARRGYVIVDKGSVTVNGVNSTVCNPTDDIFQAATIPYTYKRTSSHAFEVGSIVNLEFDIADKYISRMTQYEQQDQV